MPPPPDMPHASPPLLSFGDMGLGGAAPDPSVWSEEQQRQFIQALMAGSVTPQLPQPQLPAAAPNTTTSDDPLAAIMSSLQQMDPYRGTTTGKSPAFPAPAKPPSTLQKFMPLLHILCSWCILAYFMLFKEPQIFVERSGGALDTFWKRWAELAWRIPNSEGWSVQFVVSASRLCLWNVVAERCTALHVGFHDCASYASLDTHIHGKCKSRQITDECCTDYSNRTKCSPQLWWRLLCLICLLHSRPSLRMVCAISRWQAPFWMICLPSYLGLGC